MNNTDKKPGIVLINLGTPEAPSPQAVKEYLKEFLMDPFVIDIPKFFRWALVNLIILPKRPKISAKAYEKVWTSEGSPLKTHHLKLTQKVQELLGRDIWVEPAMRYGKPSIHDAIKRLKEKGAYPIYPLPLYPQYSLAATQSSIEKYFHDMNLLGQEPLPFPLIDFFEEPKFIDCFLQTAKPILEKTKVDYFLFSFHGLPERQIKKVDLTQSTCFATPHCCESLNDHNRFCYRAQCFTTARALAKGLNLNEDQYEVCFQSRLGRTPWIKPYTDLIIPTLPKRGIKHLAVFCPTFVADCLETLEEIGIRAKDSFIENGGESLTLIPSLNSSDSWAKALSLLIQEHLPKTVKRPPSRGELRV